MGSRGCTSGFIGWLLGVQIKRLGRVHSSRNAPVFFKRDNVLPLLVLWRKANLNKFRRCWRAKIMYLVQKDYG
jgi:hypothetical protein